MEDLIDKELRANTVQANDSVEKGSPSRAEDFETRELQEVLNRARQLSESISDDKVIASRHVSKHSIFTLSGPGLIHTNCKWHAAQGTLGRELEEDCQGSSGAAV